MQSKKVFFVAALLWTAIVAGLWLKSKNKHLGFVSPLGKEEKQVKPTPKPLAKYQFANLRKRGGKQSKIRLEKELKSQKTFTSYLFSYQSEGRKITGLINIPNRGLKSVFLEKKENNINFADLPYPVIIMLRGYVDREIYQTGIGTKNAGEALAKSGFITLAPDFLGYGGSDMPPNNVWEERFLRLTSVMDLLASVKGKKIGLWAHSNGGMIALSVLAITGEKYPAALWAPVSQFFPYDVLYYTNEFEDKGKALRKSLAQFESTYNVDNFSFDQYLDWIKAPVQIQQGTGDKYVPVSWSDNLAKKLKKLGLEVNYYVYTKADHNMKPAWQKAITRDIDFFQKSLK